jgi:hypothetical protein
MDIPSPEILPDCCLACAPLVDLGEIPPHPLDQLGLFCGAEGVVERVVSAEGGTDGLALGFRGCGVDLGQIFGLPVYLVSHWSTLDFSGCAADSDFVPLDGGTLLEFQ